MIVCEPELKVFKLQDNFDFFLLGCDGIFEQLGSQQVVDTVWDRIREQTTSKQPDELSPPNKYTQKGGRQAFHYDEHIAAAEGVEMGLRQTAVSRSLDNITILILGLKGLKKTIKQLNQGTSLDQIRHKLNQESRDQKGAWARDFFCVE